jgi:uncharacterized protein (TIRG00374 family)
MSEPEADALHGSLAGKPPGDPPAEAAATGTAASGAAAAGASPAREAVTAADASPRGAPAGRASGEQDVSVEQVSLTRRLRQPRTIISIVVPIVILVLIFRLALNVDIGLLVTAVAEANKAYLLLAFVIFYLGFPLRGLRWVWLLRGTGFRLGVRDSSEIIFLSWLVNCLVPAKLGDIYRAYLLKLNSSASLSRTFGTVFIERILDLFTITILGLAAGYWSFRSGLPPEMQFIFALGVAVVVILALLLLTLRNFGRRLLELFPLPHRVLDLYDRFEEGVFDSIGRGSLPGLLVITVLIWTTEAFRLYFVVQALAFPDVSLGISGAFFVALIASLLTAVPLSPAGLGIVELGVVGVLVTAYNIPIQEATAIALVDRAISVFSIVVLGSIAYVLSPLPRGKGLHHPLPQDLPGPEPVQPFHV